MTQNKPHEWKGKGGMLKPVDDRQGGTIAFGERKRAHPESK